MPRRDRRLGFWKRLLSNDTLRNLFFIFIGVSAVLWFVAWRTGFYDDEWLRDVLVEAHGMWFDILILGLLATVLSIVAEKKQNLQRYNEEIQDFLGWQSDEASFRIAGNIRRINQLGAVPENLSRAYLVKANLIGANLSSADLYDAFLQGAILNEANLICAMLCEADLRDAELSSADLSFANLSHANLREADLSDANLRDAKLSHAKLTGADLNSADLRDVDLSSANLRGTDLRFADLRFASLFDAALRDAKLAGADLSSADLSSADLRDVDLSSANLRHTQWDEKTVWPAAEEVAKAKNIPEALKRQLGIE